MTIAPATTDPCGRYTVYAATPTVAHTARYEPTNRGAPSTPLPSRTCRRAAGATPGSIIAAIIASHNASNDQKGPSSVATPLSIPDIRHTAMTHVAAAVTSVAVTSVAVTNAVVAVVLTPRFAAAVSTAT